MFDHYIAVDWAQRNMAISRMTTQSGKIRTIDVPSDIEELKLYLGGLRGTKILAFEETTPAHWLYTELKPFADEIVVCDPYRNRLLSEGPKTDKIDAAVLADLLRSNQSIMVNLEELKRRSGAKTAEVKPAKAPGR